MPQDLCPVKPHIAERAHIRSLAEYERLYRLSLDNPEWFWAEQAKALTWFHPWQGVFDADYDEVDFAWFSGGRLNAAFNCIDRHLPETGERTALIWVEDEPGVYQHISYRELKHNVCRETYYSTYPGHYFTGDGVTRDEAGYYWITGRIDDVINVSGHRIGTAEIESALLAHEAVAEAAVVGYPHDLKGQGIYCYVLLSSGFSNGDPDQLVGALKQQVRNAIGAFAAPDVIHIASGLPKTRSGKIMRRILRKVASSEYTGLGDVSTLAEPEVVQRLIDEHQQLRGC